MKERVVVEFVNSKINKPSQAASRSNPMDALVRQRAASKKPTMRELAELTLQKINAIESEIERDTLEGSLKPLDANITRTGYEDFLNRRNAGNQHITRANTPYQDKTTLIQKYRNPFASTIPITTADFAETILNVRIPD